MEQAPEPLKPQPLPAPRSPPHPPCKHVEAPPHTHHDGDLQARPAAHNPDLLTRNAHAYEEQIGSCPADLPNYGLLFRGAEIEVAVVHPHDRQIGITLLKIAGRLLRHPGLSP